MQSNRQTESVLDFELMEFETVPKGHYIGIFRDVQKTHHAQWGDGVMFIFEIAAGEYKGQNVARIGKPHATEKNATGKLIAGITGSFNAGQKVNLRPYIGRPFNVIIEDTQGEKTRIAAVWPYQKKPQTPQPPPDQMEFDIPQSAPAYSPPPPDPADIPF